MMSKYLVCAALAAGLAALVAPAPVSAQVGGLIRQKVKQAAQGAARTDTTAAARAAAAPKFTDDVLEITPPLLDRLEQGLVAEAAARQEIRARIGKVLPPSEYEACKQSVVTSPEYLPLAEETTRRLGSASTPQEFEKIQLEMWEKLERMLESRCGLEPGKAEQLRRQLAERPGAAAQDASRLGPRQLAILKERILPFCAAPDAFATGPAGARIPTEFKAVFWVYAPGEVEALKPRCGTLMDALIAAG